MENYLKIGIWGIILKKQSWNQGIKTCGLKVAMHHAEWSLELGAPWTLVACRFWSPDEAEMMNSVEWWVYWSWRLSESRSKVPQGGHADEEPCEPDIYSSLEVQNPSHE